MNFFSLVCLMLCIFQMKLFLKHWIDLWRNKKSWFTYVLPQILSNAVKCYYSDNHNKFEITKIEYNATYNFNLTKIKENLDGATFLSSLRFVSRFNYWKILCSSLKNWAFIYFNDSLIKGDKLKLFFNNCILKQTWEDWRKLLHQNYL